MLTYRNNYCYDYSICLTSLLLWSYSPVMHRTAKSYCVMSF